MPTITDNTRRFIENSGIDYFTHFIKAWIPFNSWYNQKWPDLQTDKESINKIKDCSNEVRSAIVNFLESEEDNAKKFRSYLSGLHFQLMENTIENRGNRITFQNVVVGKNKTNKIEEVFRGVKYKLTRKDKRFEVEEIKIQLLNPSNDSEKFPSIVQSDYNLDDLKENRDYLQLSKSRQEQLIKYYQELIPYQKINLLESNPREATEKETANYTSIGSFKFIENKEKIAQGLIEIIYSLRCVLFHGTLNPNEANNEVYNNLYNILFMIIQKLR